VDAIDFKGSSSSAFLYPVGERQSDFVFRFPETFSVIHADSTGNDTIGLILLFPLPQWERRQQG
jgi:hypothetical protein